jgi:hypothetical protein
MIMIYEILQITRIIHEFIYEFIYMKLTQIRYGFMLLSWLGILVERVTMSQS